MSHSEQRNQGQSGQNEKNQGSSKDRHARKVIHTIHSGSKFDSNLAWCNYVQEARHSPKCRPDDLFEVSFGVEDARATHFPHKDVLVITIEVANFMVRKLLMDNESSTNIIFWVALEAMGIS